MFRIPPHHWLCCVLLAMLSLPVAHAANDSWRYDLVHSQVVFSISHNGYSRPFGRLHIARGWLRFDPQDWSTAATELEIDLASVDMGDAPWNRAVCAANLLDCERHRYAHFRSLSVERIDQRHGVLHGELTIRGVTHPLDLDFTFNRAARTIFESRKIAGFSATTTLDRNDFGITAHPGSIGAQVNVWLELETVNDRNAVPPVREQP